MILLIDNYDSFTYNLRRYLIQLGQQVEVVRNDSEKLQADVVAKYSAIVISPGPKTPRDAGHCLHVVKRFSGSIPILGVCLGHQVIFQAFGGNVGRAIRPMHGKTSSITIQPSRLFHGIESGSAFARYHSLIGVKETLPTCLRVTAWSPQEEIMAIEHVQHPTFGVQFHPESVLSLNGHRLLLNFLGLIRDNSTLALPTLDLLDPAQAAFAPDERAWNELPVALPGPVRSDH